MHSPWLRYPCALKRSHSNSITHNTPNVAVSHAHAQSYSTLSTHARPRRSKRRRGGAVTARSYDIWIAAILEVLSFCHKLHAKWGKYHAAKSEKISLFAACHTVYIEGARRHRRAPRVHGNTWRCAAVRYSAFIEALQHYTKEFYRKYILEGRRRWVSRVDVGQSRHQYDWCY